MAITTSTDLDYLIDDLRIHLGDFTEEYTYATTYLRPVLVMACPRLMKKWKNRYTINSTYVVTRSATALYYEDSPPVIEVADEQAFVLQSSIIVKSADLKEAAWDIGSWRDDEIAYSNIAGASAFEKSLAQDVADLDTFMEKRLFTASKQSLPGFTRDINYYEG